LLQLRSRFVNLTITINVVEWPRRQAFDHSRAIQSREQSAMRITRRSGGAISFV